MIEEKLVMHDMAEREKIDELVDRLFERHRGRITVTVLPAEWALIARGGISRRQRGRIVWRK